MMDYKGRYECAESCVREDPDQLFGDSCESLMFDQQTRMRRVL